VTRVRRPDTAHPAAIADSVQPADELGPNAAAQHAPALQTRALAGDDQDDAEILRHGCIKKIGDRAFGCGERHAVQVERRLRDKLAASQGACRVTVEIMIIECQFRRRCHPKRSAGPFLWL